MTETENRVPPNRKTTLLLLAAGVVAIVITLGINVDVIALFGGLLGAR